MNENIFKNKLINEYQKLFYFQGYRNIWQYNPNCAEKDLNLVYRPKIGRCEFNNVEFKTLLNFDKNSRIHKAAYDKNKKPIVILGDSHAMGWGVQDHETFASLIQEKLNIKVYNQAVSSYGTFRELKKLELSGIVNEVDTIIIQYSDNDRSENINLINNPEKIINSDFSFSNQSSKIDLNTFFKFFRRSIKIPLQLFNNEKERSFNEHFEPLHNVLKKFSGMLKDKRIIIFYSNSHGLKFNDFERFNDNLDFKNISLIDLNIKRDFYYVVDDHLTSDGHKFIARKLIGII